VSSSVKTGANVALRLTVDAFGRVSNVSVLNVGAMLGHACAQPTPTHTPEPSGSFAPLRRTSRSDSPSFSPDETPERSVSALTGASVAAPSNATCDQPGAVAAVQGQGPAGLELPSTDSIAKAASLFAVTAFPTFLLMALGFVGGVLAWRRRMQRDATGISIQPTVVDDSPAAKEMRS
jgi:hypothetical protein